jgi:hypothetical protein
MSIGAFGEPVKNVRGSLLERMMLKKNDVKHWMDCMFECCWFMKDDVVSCLL